MTRKHLDRRQFLVTVSLAPALAALSRHNEAWAAPAVAWPIGCFNRPWMRWGQEAAIQGARDAGYPILGLLSVRSASSGRSAQDPEDPEQYLLSLREKILAVGLAVNMAGLRSRHDVPLEESVSEVKDQVDRAARLSLPFLMSLGVSDPAHYEHYYRVMAEAAAYGQEKGIQLAVKPHGGVTAASEEMLRCLEKVDHPNFKIWYDPGNIIYYTGKDPVEELGPVLPYVTGVCAKDCSGPRGEVMIEFGTGKVDFDGVFTLLKEAGFGGPVMVETCAGETLEEVTRGARANRLFLERLRARLVEGSST